MKFRSNRLIPTNEWRKRSKNNKRKDREKIIRKEIKNKKTTRSETVLKTNSSHFCTRGFSKKVRNVCFLQIIYDNLLHEGGKNYYP